MSRKNFQIGTEHRTTSFFWNISAATKGLERLTKSIDFRRKINMMHTNTMHTNGMHRDVMHTNTMHTNGMHTDVMHTCFPNHIPGTFQKHEMANREHLYNVEALLVSRSKRELADGTVKEPMHKLRLLCFSRGASGLLSLGRTFRSMDDDGYSALTLKQFMNGIHHTGIDCSKDEIRNMFHSFDKNNSGTINLTEFLQKLRPPMNQGRLDIIDRAFQKIDHGGNGVVTTEAMKAVYSVKEHPKYETGEMTANELKSQFVEHFEVGNGSNDGLVTKEDFEHYYATVSAAIDNDMFFDLLMRRSFTL